MFVRIVYITFFFVVILLLLVLFAYVVYAASAANALPLLLRLRLCLFLILFQPLLLLLQIKWIYNNSYIIMCTIFLSRVRICIYFTCTTLERTLQQWQSAVFIPVISLHTNNNFVFCMLNNDNNVILSSFLLCFALQSCCSSLCVFVYCFLLVSTNIIPHEIPSFILDWWAEQWV